MDFITEEERAELDAIKRNIDRLYKEMIPYSDRRLEIGNQVFLRFLQSSKWSLVRTTDERFIMEPEDSRVITRFLMEVLSLGWHDNFHFYAGGMYVDGFVDDGKLTLSLDCIHSEGTKEFQDNVEEFKTLNVDFDFGPMLKSAIQDQVSNLNKQIELITASRDSLMEKLNPSSGEVNNGS